MEEEASDCILGTIYDRHSLHTDGHRGQGDAADLDVPLQALVARGLVRHDAGRLGQRRHLSAMQHRRTVVHLNFQRGQGRRQQPETHVHTLGRPGSSWVSPGKPVPALPSMQSTHHGACLLLTSAASARTLARKTGPRSAAHTAPCGAFSNIPPMMPAKPCTAPGWNVAQRHSRALFSKKGGRHQIEVGAEVAQSELADVDNRPCGGCVLHV